MLHHEHLAIWSAFLEQLHNDLNLLKHCSFLKLFNVGSKLVEIKVWSVFWKEGKCNPVQPQQLLVVKAMLMRVQQVRHIQPSMTAIFAIPLHLHFSSVVAVDLEIVHSWELFSSSVFRLILHLFKDFSLISFTQKPVILVKNHFDEVYVVWIRADVVNCQVWLLHEGEVDPQVNEEVILLVDHKVKLLVLLPVFDHLRRIFTNPILFLSLIWILVLSILMQVGKFVLFKVSVQMEFVETFLTKRIVSAVMALNIRNRSFALNTIDHDQDVRLGKQW